GEGLTSNTRDSAATPDAWRSPLFLAVDPLHRLRGSAQKVSEVPRGRHDGRAQTLFVGGVEDRDTDGGFRSARTHGYGRRDSDRGGDDFALRQRVALAARLFDLGSFVVGGR